MEENRGPAPAKFAALPEKRAPPKPTPPPRMPTPPAKPPADPPPWKPPPWKPPPPKPPPPPPPCPAAHVMGASVTKVMPTSKLIKFFVFMFHDHSRYASKPLRVCGIL